MRLKSIVFLIIILLVAVAAGFVILRTGSGGISGSGLGILSTGGRGADKVLSRFSPEAQQMLARLASRHRLGQQELSSDESSRLLRMLADDARSPEERLSLLFWRLLGRGEVPEPVVLEVLDAGDRLASALPEWGFVRARICVLYSHPLAGGRQLATFIPRTLEYAHSASEASPECGLYQFYELGLRWVAAYRCGREMSAETGQSVLPPLELTELSSMIERLAYAKDWRQRLPPPYLTPFDSFALMPLLLREKVESDYPWEKLNPYGLLIVQQFGREAVDAAVRGEPEPLISLLRLQLAQLRLEPSSVYTFKPGVEGIDVLLREMERGLPRDTFSQVKPLAEEFRRLREELGDTSAIVQQHPELLRGGAAKDPRLLFQRIFAYYRDPVSAAVSRIIEVLQELPSGEGNASAASYSSEAPGVK